MPLEYILIELLKNAFRATVESRGSRGASNLPPIHITLASDEIDFWIRISDHAGGIPQELENAIWEYHMSTPAAANVEAGWESGPLASRTQPLSVVKEPDVFPPPTPSGGSLDPHIVVSREAVEEALSLPKPPHTLSPALPLGGPQGFFSGLTQHHVALSIHGAISLEIKTSKTNFFFIRNIPPTKLINLCQRSTSRLYSGLELSVAWT
ncbi:unnamed protein product [Echinostoma caproni]|uniref:Protein-serine/threonine kinase n=1 Tax=Echinostoma caproni TaxID=27848 RepID=A0A183AHE5_9TREM|nr:unnamed protein product [Echinostoma caproni]